VYYKFPNFEGKNGEIRTGYIRIDIRNGSGGVVANDSDQVALAKAHGGILDTGIPPKKSKKQVTK
jgi:hypothetical protein